MKLVAHASPLVLEAELLDGVAAAKASDPLAPVLIVVTTRGLADHLSHRLVERFGALVGVLVLNHRALAERVMERAGARRLRILGEDLIDTLFSRVMHGAPAGRLRDFVLEHPGAAASLRKTLTDLREAGIDAKAAIATLSGAEAEIATLHARWCDALDELARTQGVGDDAELARAALPAAAKFAAGFAAIFHHGAYDLIGVHADLVRALDRGRELTFLLPADPADESGRFGRDSALQIASPCVVTPLAREFKKAQVSYFHAQGARAELRTAAYEALAAVAAGVPPHEIAIVVRSFRLYGAALDALFDEHRLLWQTSYKQPLRRDPVAAAALRAIAGESESGPRRWSEHADAFVSLAGEGAGNEALSRLLENARAIETVLGDDRLVSRREAHAWLDARADATNIPPETDGDGGIRILDAMQARGITFAQLSLAGMNAGTFPRLGREDPFLPDASRRLLHEATGLPLPIASRSSEEEHLLLSMLLGSARLRIGVSWQRSDEAARPLVASLALRDVVRFAESEAAPEAVLNEARAIPAHPLARLRAWAKHPGLLDRRDETLLAALGAEAGLDAGAAVAARRPELAHGIALVAATETFQPTSGTYDGRIGLPVVRDSMAASALERLGRCPMQFFFHDGLHVRAPIIPPTPFTEDPRTIGTRVHEVLQRVYAGLRNERAFESPDPAARIDRARVILREAWDETADDEARARAARFPVLARIDRDAWLRTLDAFLGADLARLAESGLTPVAFEQTMTAPIPGGPPGLPVTARFDRVLELASARVVSDYKTGRRLASRVTASAMLSGKALQVPIYAMIARASVELLGVGRDNEPEVARFDDFKKPEHREGVLETLRVAASLAMAGRFPIRPDDDCRTCDYRPACRRGHPPTEFREGRAEDVRDARDCWRKSAGSPTLAALRREAGS